MSGTTGHWAADSFFYHIYPLGLCGAPEKNDFSSAPIERLDALHPWLDHIRGLGANAVYIGPLFESGSHGYDTADYFTVDRRLGTNGGFRRLCDGMRERGLRIVLDAVFNHVGRDHWAFRDVRENGERSPYAGWFHSLKFGGRSPLGDPFTYEGWSGHHSLVKLNLSNPEVRAHLFQAVDAWVREFGIDGLRLDAADVMDEAFLRELAAHCRALRPDFWLMGEMVHGDYRRLANPGALDSATNYECYKGLYSSHVDRNFFEIAWSLNRQFGPAGIYRGLSLYSFADNHDVDRGASLLRDPADLATVYLLLFTMPGIPSVYYGSEWGIEGRKDGSDRPLRPALDLESAPRNAANRGLAPVISRLARVRGGNEALRAGDYVQLHVNHERLAFARTFRDRRVVVAVNSGADPAPLRLELPGLKDAGLVDLLNPGDSFRVMNGKAVIDPLPPRWGRILEVT
jgi:cyclomaltodextrinase / maltogenic alpha-amylase / neopullulanase